MSTFVFINFINDSHPTFYRTLKSANNETIIFHTRQYIIFGFKQNRNLLLSPPVSRVINFLYCFISLNVVLKKNNKDWFRYFNSWLKVSTSIKKQRDNITIKCLKTFYPSGAKMCWYLILVSVRNSYFCPFIWMKLKKMYHKQGILVFPQETKREDSCYSF